MLLRRFLELLRKIPPLKLDEVDLAVAAGPALAVTLGARVAVRAFACGAAYAARNYRIHLFHHLDGLTFADVAAEQRAGQASVGQARRSGTVVGYAG